MDANQTFQLCNIAHELTRKYGCSVTVIGRKDKDCRDDKDSGERKSGEVKNCDG